MKRKKIDNVAAKLGIVEEIMKDKEDDLNLTNRAKAFVLVAKVINDAARKG